MGSGCVRRAPSQAKEKLPAAASGRERRKEHRLLDVIGMADSSSCDGTSCGASSRRRSPINADGWTCRRSSPKRFSAWRPAHVREPFAAGRAPITYVSQQLGHADASITLKVHAHYLPDASRKDVDLLDAQPAATPAQPEAALSAAEASELANCSKKELSREGIEPSTRRLRVCCSAN